MTNHLGHRADRPMRKHQSGIGPVSANEIDPKLLDLALLGVGCRVGSREQKITLDSPLAPRGVA